MKKERFNELLESLAQAKDIRLKKSKPSRVFTYDPIDIKRIRTRLHTSQSQFAMMIGVSRATLQNWEQGRRKPEGPAQALLRIAEKRPDAVLEALQAK
ncbi:MAG TPA: NadS family protein [Kiritimatiellia bacterium]|nr:NadS family protein [Kiritimatiellia bacterium]HMP33673.1 NadS family protein [Kiritimatiellia bacterium]